MVWRNGENMVKLSKKCLNAMDNFLLNCPDISEDEREQILEKIGLKTKYETTTY